MAVVNIHYKTNKGRVGQFVDEVPGDHIADISEAVVKLVVRHLYPQTSSHYPYPEAITGLPTGNRASDKLARATQVAKALGFIRLSFNYLEPCSVQQLEEHHALI